MTGLNIPAQSLTVGAAEVDAIKHHWSTEAAVQAQVAQWGFEPLQRPNYTPPVVSPEQLVSLDNNAFTDLMARTNAWLNYAESNYASILSSIRSTEGALKRVKAKIIKQMLDQAKDQQKPKPTKDAQTNATETHPAVEDLEHRLQVLMQQKDLQGAHFEIHKRNAALVSRSIEIRKIAWEAHRGHHNAPNRHMNPNAQPGPGY